jgi:arylsulfatase A-like enzyme
MYAPVSYTNKALVSAFAGIPPSPEPVVGEVEAFPGGVPAVGLPHLLAGQRYRTGFITPAEMEFERKDRILRNLGFAEHLGDGDFATQGFSPKAYFGYEDRIVLDRTFEWVDNAAASGEPFFLGMLTLSSHHPYDLPPDATRREYGSVEEDLDDYLNSVSYTDRFVRSIYHGLAERGLLESTVFVVLGDHGEAFGEHGARTHGDVIWDETLHVPAVIVGPGISAGSRARGLRTTGDVVPTIAELLGYSIEGGRLPAMSLLHPVPPDRTLYHSTKNGRVALALRRNALKYIYWGRRQPMQVFDIERDPYERNDIADRVDPTRLRAVEAELLAWRAGVAGAYRAARDSATAR